MTVRDLPTLNAALNGLAAALLITGWVFIRRREIARHRLCMLSAFGVSVLFLASYLVYHYHVGSVRFPDLGWVRTLYLGILLTHTVLAAAVPVLAVLTLLRAFQERFDRHRRIARWTLPIWIYVSITGVVIYWMLYHLAA
jgi:putative membrane protein